MKETASYYYLNNEKNISSGKRKNPHAYIRDSLERSYLPPLEVFLERPQIVNLEELKLKTDIPSSIGPFTYTEAYKAQYPESIKQAITGLYREYNKAFIPLVEANREWPTDYQYCMTGPDNTPVNYFVQIDMVGLPDQYLEKAGNVSGKNLDIVLKRRIFEIENSLAMYGLMRNIFSQNGQESAFKSKFDTTLNFLRQRFGKPIALLATTEEKYQAMRETEFGKHSGNYLGSEEVKQISGFDRFFSPRKFLEHLAQNEGECDYLLYVRSSDPVTKLKKPETQVENPLLSVDEVRRVIKKNSITFNIDNPRWETGSEKRINDTKAYLPLMNMAYRIDSPEDAWTVTTIKNGQAPKVTLNERLQEYLLSYGFKMDDLTLNAKTLRAKPMQSSYGCYGHVLVDINNGKDRQEVKRGLRDRGPYLIQPEMTTPVVINSKNGQSFTYIDRNFFSTNGAEYQFVGGFRSLMPLQSMEAKQKRIHGNSATVWVEIA